MKFTSNTFPNSGFLTVYFSDTELLPIRNEIYKMMSNDFDCVKEYNHKLVGNINKEYKLIESKEHMEKLILPLCHEHDKIFKHLSQTQVLNKSVPLSLNKAWVNFQEKYEFNPTHNHTGIYSFVVWLNIPFENEEEKKQIPSIRLNSSVSGNFEFLYTDILGNIKQLRIDADKHSKNVGLLFPSKLNHCVYPFFTSNDYRISISGNFTLTV